MKNFIQIGLIVVFAVLFFNQCRLSTEKEKINKNNQLALLDSISYYENELGKEVAEKKAFKGSASELELILEQKKDSNEQLRVALKKWKRLKSVTTTETITKIDSVKVPFEVKIPCDFERNFKKEDPFYTIAGKVNETGLKFDEISFPNTQTLVVGDKKTSFFKTEFRMEVTNSNPYIKTTSIDNFTFIEKEKRFGLGFSFGFGIYSSGFFVGPSINYNLIEF
jgi:hypothetical protein